MNDSFIPQAGRCTCGALHYKLLRRPLVVHCCHCTWCQRETGAAFALNALVETAALEVLEGTTEAVHTPSSSGRGQTVVRCAKCRVALWSHYGGAGNAIAFVRVGTLEQPDLFPPDIHIYTSTKQKWVQLDSRVPAVPEFYRRSQYWPAESVERYNKALGRSA